VLIDSTPQLEGLPLRTANSIGESPSKILRFETWIVPAQPRALANSFFMAGDNLVLGQILNLFKHHTLQSIFPPRSIPVYQEEQIDKRNHLNKHVFVLLLLETSWRVSVNLLQSELNKLQHDATTIAGDRAFKMLAGLRRQLADAYELLAEVHGVVDDRLKSRPIRWNANGVDLQPEAFWSDKRSQSVAVNIRQAKSVDLRDLPDLLEELVGRIKSMTKTVNEEIQIVIGSVQVEDARVMRRQTEWTVVLAVLAAIYLPMTLVTGIFGMNITDFSAESTAPDRWSVVNAWGIVFGVTMGSILVYAVVRYALRYWRVGRMLLKRNMKKIGDGWLYRKGFAFKIRVQQLWLYRKIRGFGEKMKEWDVEAQKMEKME
jgi:Mg2+ and Co2+ transporter CorA